MFELLKHFIALTSETPEVTIDWVAQLNQFLNSTWGQITTGGAITVGGAIGVLKTLIPANKQFINLTSGVRQVQTAQVTDNAKIKELEERLAKQKAEYDEKLALIAKHSPNAKLKAFGDELLRKAEEQKAKLQMPKFDKLEETIKVLKEK